ncbi:hypothetical protein PRUPE_6G159300 [Prunus persica]|uniref:Uncharacterized protein n=1 Tax=Prunus persica TaxID=3760 RepID=A0A251NRC7_PRUPE|nr:hypothetical protein PRUPE_6G159300 [Prunus persica]
MHSIECPCVCPPYLAEGLDIFRRVRMKSGFCRQTRNWNQTSEFCAHALLAFEVLMHPRVLRLADFANAPSLSDSLRECVHKDLFVYESDHDDLYDSWLANSKEMEAQVSDLGKTMQAGEPSKTTTVHWDKTLYVDGSFSKETLVGSAQELTATIEDVEMRGNGDENMVESHQLQDSIV